MQITFFGAPYFSKQILKFLLDNSILIDTVVTHPDQPMGRKKILEPTPIKVLAQENNILIREFHRLDNSAIDIIKESRPDLFIVASYGAILPAKLLNIPRFGALNVHPSLLPKLRGASPIQTSLLHGLQETGTTIMLMDSGMDTGNIVKQEKLPIKPKEVYPQLEQRLIDVSNKLLFPIVKKIIKTNKKPTATKQNNNEATYTKIIKKQDALIDWKKSAKEIYNQWRAFSDWPQVYTFYNGQKLTLNEIEIFSESAIMKKDNIFPGRILITKKKELLVYTSDKFIKITKLQLSGKNKLSSKDFLNGQPNFSETTLKNA